MTSLAKTYEPKGFEKIITELWESAGAFRADAFSDKPAFTISMPPPNATGQLHVGHAVMLVLEDIFIRWHRMMGHEALWLPGTCLLYTSPSPRDKRQSRMPSSA